jgi:negative regulator of flagellin synthesis FlgM
MRIDLYNSSASQISSEASSAKVNTGKTATSEVSSGEDRTTLASDSTSISSLVSSALKSPEVRQDKVDSLRQAVSSGQYKLEPSEIAGSIVDDHA